MLRETLETPRRLTVRESSSEEPVNELLVAANAWLRFAGHKVMTLSNISFDKFDPKVSALGELARNENVTPGGFSPSRWLFWRRRLKIISQCDQKQVAMNGHGGFSSMSFMV